MVQRYTSLLPMVNRIYVFLIHTWVVGVYALLLTKHTDAYILHSTILEYARNIMVSQKELGMRTTIICPVDGATNIKLEVLDFETLETLSSTSTGTPRTTLNNMEYNCTQEEFTWFDESIKALPAELKNAAVIAPVARGASGGLIGADNTLLEEPGKGVTLAYSHTYSAAVEERFAALAGDEAEFFQQTGTVRSFPGSLALLKRLLFEEMERPELLAKAVGFLYYGGLMAGHFMGDKYKEAWKKCGNEYSYWMCHTGARAITDVPGTLSTLAGKIESYARLVPQTSVVTYRSVGTLGRLLAVRLGLKGANLIIPGGHDTCLSHIPVLSSFYQAFPQQKDKPVIHVDAGTWTMVAHIGGSPVLPADGYTRGMVVQGTVDGAPVVTAMYAGGNDFKYVKEMAEKRGLTFGGALDEDLLLQMLTRADSMVLPNIHPDNVGTGPFPQVQGVIINEEAFFADGARAALLTNLTTAITTSVNIDAVAHDHSTPLVLTAGGSRDPYFGRLLATLTGRTVYSMQGKNGDAVTETTTLGAALAGKAACRNKHPYEVSLKELGIGYREVAPFSAEIKNALAGFREKLLSAYKK